MRSVRVALAILSLAVGACAGNALRVEYAGEVGARGEAFGPQAQAYLDRVEATRRRSNVELIANDPTCFAPTAHVRLARLPPDRRQWLCVPAADTVTRSVALGMGPIRDDLEPTLVAIDALLQYTGALGEIAGRRAPDVEAQFQKAAAAAANAQTLVNALTGHEGGPVPGPDDPRIAALGKFAAFVGMLAHETHQVAALRAVVRDNPEGARPLVRALRQQLGSWELSRKADEALLASIRADLLRDKIVGPASRSVADRRAALNGYYDDERLAASQTQYKVALDQLLAALADADEAFRRVIVADPAYSKADRARLAAIREARVLEALDVLTRIATSFKGA